MNKNKAINKFQILYQELNSIIMEWDPYGLLKAGEIDDEFSNEVYDILSALTQVEHLDDAINSVQKVFTLSFSEHDFPRNKCVEVGKKVFAWWETHD